LSDMCCASEQFVVNLPLSVKVSSKAKFILNINNYRNAHYHVLNKAKIEFADMIRPIIEQLPKLSTVNIHYQVYPKDNRLFDISNVCSIVDKFFCDVLQECAVIENDNYNYVKHISYSFGNVDKKNPRVVAIITG